MTVTMERLMQVADKLVDITNEELLMEVRRRDLLGRVDAHEIIPGWRIAMGSHPPDDYVFTRLGRLLGEKISVWKLPGKKIQEGHFLDPVHPYHTKDRKLTLVFNFVKENP